MKKNKIIGLLVGLGGIIGSFAAAAALYVKNVSPVGFGIGAHYSASDGDITFLINGKAEGSIDPSYLTSDGTNDGEALGALHETKGFYTQAKYEFPLSAVYSSHAQDFVVGNFKFELKSISEEIVNHASVWVALDGIESLDDFNVKDDQERDGHNWYGYSDDNKFFNYHEEIINSSHYYDDRITASSYTCAKDIVIPTSSDGKIKVVAYVKLDADVITDGTMLNLAEKTPFTVEATWGEPANFEFAYVRGDGNDWTSDELYAMVPNFKSKTGFEWYYTGLTGFTNAKAFKQYHPTDDSQNYSSGENLSLEASHSYAIYWNGSASSEAFKVQLD